MSNWAAIKPVLGQWYLLWWLAASSPVRPLLLVVDLQPLLMRWHPQALDPP